MECKQLEETLKIQIFVLEEQCVKQVVVGQIVRLYGHISFVHVILSLAETGISKAFFMAKVFFGKDLNYL